MQLSDLDNILNSVIRRATEQKADPRATTLDKVALQARIELAYTMKSYVHKIKSKQEAEIMIQGLIAGDKGKVSELPGRVRKPSELEVSILEIAGTLKPGEFIPIEAKRVSYIAFSTKLGNMKKAGQIGKDYGLRKIDDKKYAFHRKEVQKAGADEEKGQKKTANAKGAAHKKAA